MQRRPQVGQWTRLAAGVLAFGGVGTLHAQDFSQYSGEQLFQRFCASCHGKAADGDGAVAPVLQIHPPDLTQIAKRSGGKFPDNKVYWIIDGRTPVAAHGTRDMPVWGLELWREQGFDVEAGRKTATIIEKLVDYLKSVQKSGKRKDETGSAPQ